MNVKILFLLILMPYVTASGVGIFPLNENVEIKPFQRFRTNIYLFNPSNDDVFVYTNASCFINGKVYDYINFYPKELSINKNTSILEAKPIIVSIQNPLFIENNQSIFNYNVLFGENKLKCRFYAKTNDTTPIIVTSNINVILIGINLAKLGLIVFTLLVLGYFGINKIGKKSKKYTKNYKTHHRHT
ncbi:MAG: hypothetical protein QXM68_01570 [Candidatus Aenigmatarchaeota archaeon]|nr:hypothetical protein [Candidatus Aenigmarchaeota archaeon]